MSHGTTPPKLSLSNGAAWPTSKAATPGARCSASPRLPSTATARFSSAPQHKAPAIPRCNSSWPTASAMRAPRFTSRATRPPAKARKTSSTAWWSIRSYARSSTAIWLAMALTRRSVLRTSRHSNLSTLARPAKATNCATSRRSPRPSTTSAMCRTPSALRRWRSKFPLTSPSPSSPPTRKARISLARRPTPSTAKTTAKSPSNPSATQAAPSRASAWART